MAARPRGGRGGVTERDGWWYGCYRDYPSSDLNAKPVQREKRIGPSKGPKKITKSKAREIIAAFLTRRTNPNTIALTATMGDLWEWYSTRFESRSAGHRVAMNSIWKCHLQPRFGAKQPGQIQIGDVYDHLTSLPRRTAESARSLLSALFNLAMRHHLIVTSPVEDAAVRIPGAKSGGTLDLDEVRAIAQRLDGADLVKFYLFALLALDRSAARGLRRNDILPEGLRIDEGYVEGAVTQLKTETRHAIIPLPPQIAGLLAPLAADSTDWLWKAEARRGPWDARAWLEGTLRPIAKALGIKKHIDFRMLRRTALTLARQSGATPEAAAGIGRHGVETAMKHYWDASQAEPQRAALSAVWEKITSKGQVM